jgi:hypothetical protein
MRGSERGIDLLALAEAARDPTNLPDGMTPGLDADAYNDSDVFTFPNGCHAAEIEIDPETGAVTLERYLAIDDYGRLINPMLTMGQVQGGVAQGIGQALLEHTVYEEQSGQLLSGFVPGLCPAARRRPAAARHYPRRVANRGKPARGQGRGPGRLHGGAADHHQRDPRCACASRHRAYRYAGHSRADLARDPQCARWLTNSRQPEAMREGAGSPPKTLRPPSASDACRACFEQLRKGGAVATPLSRARTTINPKRRRKA